MVDLDFVFVILMAPLFLVVLGVWLSLNIRAFKFAGKLILDAIFGES